MNIPLPFILLLSAVFVAHIALKWGIARPDSSRGIAMAMKIAGFASLVGGAGFGIYALVASVVSNFRGPGMFAWMMLPVVLYAVLNEDSEVLFKTHEQFIGRPNQSPNPDPAAHGGSGSLQR